MAPRVVSEYEHCEYVNAGFFFSLRRVVIFADVFYYHQLSTWSKCTAGALIIRTVNRWRANIGYSIHFPMIKHDAFRGLSNGEVNLYKFMFAPDLQPPTLAIIGCMIGLGADAPMREMQCRLAAKVFKVRNGMQSRLTRLDALATVTSTLVCAQAWRATPFPAAAAVMSERVCRSGH